MLISKHVCHLDVWEEAVSEEFLKKSIRALQIKKKILVW
jgi:hypothetical protein